MAATLLHQQVRDTVGHVPVLISFEGVQTTNESADISSSNLRRWLLWDDHLCFTPLATI